MNRPLEIGERVVVGGNLLPYAKAIVSERIFNVAQQRWGHRPGVARHASGARTPSGVQHGVGERRRQALGTLR